MAEGKIPPTWIVIDSQLTLNLFKNAELLTRIKTVGNQANVHTYAGMRSTKQVSHHPLFNMNTWLYPQGIAKILSPSIVTKLYPVDFDTEGKLFTVHLQDR